jgi:glycosyltransferase involved in cell wall biosynthesis
MVKRIKADIVHVHMPPRFFVDFASIIHSIRPFSTLILSYHLYLETAPSLTNAISNLHYKTVGRFIFGNSDKIIVPTETYRAFLGEHFGIRQDKISVVPHGVDLEAYDPKKYDKEEVKRRYGLSSHKIVLFVGRLDSQGAKQKGIKYLLEAAPLVAEEISNVKFIIAGSGDQLSHLKALSIKLGASPYVEFVGNFPDSQAGLFYSMADAVALPSLSESFGIVLCEAMAMEKPTIATCIRGIVDVVENGKTGLLVEPRNSKALAKAIVNVLSDENLAKRLGVEGRKHVERKYTWDLSVQRTLKIYEECYRANLA